MEEPKELKPGKKRGAKAMYGEPMLFIGISIPRRYIRYMKTTMRRNGYRSMSHAFRSLVEERATTEGVALQ